MSVQRQPQPNASRVLVACIGNIFLGDDGFGVEVARRMAGRRYPEGVQVADFGIRGIELAYSLLDGCDTLILVDAVARGGRPGTLYLIEAEEDSAALTPDDTSTGVTVDGHSMEPLKVLAFAHRLGARPRRVLVVGCQPAPLESEEQFDDVQVGLSEPVRAAVDEAVTMVESLIERVLAGTDDIPNGKEV